MKSQKSIPSSKSLLSIDTKKLIDLKCKQDHFGFKKQLPIKKNYSSYTSAYKDIDPDKVVSNFEIQKYQRAIAPASLDQKLLKRSLHESNNHFSQNKSHKLPNIQIGSVYNRSFHTQSLERLVKGKPKDGFFLKSQWHENPSSIYKKSYMNPKSEIQNLNEKGKPLQDQLAMVRTPFRASTNYEQSYNNSMNTSTFQQDSSICLKSKDHLSGIDFPMKGKSEYKSRFDKQNLPSQKSIGSKKKIGLLPEIKPAGRYHKKEIHEIPKKSMRMKKTQSSAQQNMIKSQSHSLMIGNVMW